MLNKEMYLHLEKMLKGKDGPSKKDVLDSFREELLYELTELYTNDKKDELDKELHAFRRFKKLLQNETEENLSYQIGVIIGVIAAIETLAHQSSAKHEFNIKMSALLSKEINRNIVSYLYEHPGSQSKTIAQDLGIPSNDLSQRMGELEEAGGVVHYGVDESSFYELTVNDSAIELPSMETCGVVQ